MEEPGGGGSGGTETGAGSAPGVGGRVPFQHLVGLPPRGGAAEQEVLDILQAQGERHVAALNRLTAAQEDVRRLQEDETKVGEGTMGALRGDARWWVYLARGCDEFRVDLCPGLLGKDLFDGLRRVGDAARALLTQVGFPVPISNRIAYGFAAGTWGGRDPDHLPSHCLSAADFPKCTEETFDNWIPPTTTKLENRPQKPTTAASWHKHTTNQIVAWGLVMGREHQRERELARDRLELLHVVTLVISDIEIWHLSHIHSKMREALAFALHCTKLALQVFEEAVQFIFIPRR